MKFVLIGGLFLFLIFGRLSTAGATEEYAQQTGKACSVCHLSPAGGGELTAAGKEFAASRHAGVAQTSGVDFKKIVRFVAGYLHLLVAIMWFGTILYVHLVLKPAYAVGGLPPGEVRVGVLSIVTMAVTGAILTTFRVTSLDMLLHTRFGVLLLVKIGLFLVMLVAAVIAVGIIGPRLKRKGGGGGSVGGTFTVEDLAAFDGKEGRAAYFAWEGTVYDASKSKLWRQGEHMKRHAAGADLTESLHLAPHGSEQITALPVVGKLEVLEPGKVPLHQRVFFFLAYLNLAIVFIIVFIVALWRWW